MPGAHEWLLNKPDCSHVQDSAFAVFTPVFFHVSKSLDFATSLDRAPTVGTNSGTPSLYFVKQIRASIGQSQNVFGTVACSIGKLPRIQYAMLIAFAVLHTSASPRGYARA